MHTHTRPRDHTARRGTARARRAGAETSAHVPGFRAVDGHDPYPWQRRYYAHLVEGTPVDAVDIATGLGKTACVLLALLARLENPSLPRRIVYVVDRRAIVDQTAKAVRTWIERIAALPALARAFDAGAAFAAERPVALGVLRGGLADDGAWRLDPARAAVIVGTVDGVGSRVLFSGYGAGRSRRAMDAGLLAHDALVLLDEAHLAPAFDALLATIARMQGGEAFRCTTLSATGARAGTVLGLTSEDYAEAAVRRRIAARKSPRFVEAATASQRIARITTAAAAYRTGAVVVFVERVSDARLIAAGLIKALGAEGKARVALLTGTLRGRERAALVDGAVWRRFRPEGRRPAPSPAVVLVSTAAGEVGVDLDADHAVMDLVPFGSMVQRLGRVNRAGLGAAEVTIVFTSGETAPPRRPPATHDERRHAARVRTLELLRGLADLSPRSLRAVDPGAAALCSAPAPAPAPLERAVLDAFAATSAALPLPPVAVYLRGVSDAPDTAECHLAWRRDVPELARLGAEAARAAAAFYRPAPAELARVPAPQAYALILRAIERAGDEGLPLVVVGADGAVFAQCVHDAPALPPLAYATVLLPPDAGGLTAAGLPDADAHLSVDDVADTEARIRYVLPHEGAALPAWAERALELRIALGPEDGADARSLVYALRRPDPGLWGGVGWLGASSQTVQAHCAEVAAAARRIGAALGLPAALVDALECAGAWHDRGKGRRVWQLAAGAPAGGPALAKSRRGRFRPHWLGGYRHEFGSLVDAERALAPELPHRDLILHLIAAHHGWARPGFPRRARGDPEASAKANRACAVRAAHRYAALAARYGPWRLAWLEALVKAADAHASSGAAEKGR